jgi:hypothetical protein
MFLEEEDSFYTILDARRWVYEPVHVSRGCGFQTLQAENNAAG